MISFVVLNRLCRDRLSRNAIFFADPLAEID